MPLIEYLLHLGRLDIRLPKYIERRIHLKMKFNFSLTCALQGKEIDVRPELVEGVRWGCNGANQYQALVLEIQ